MFVPLQRRTTPYEARMLAMADRLFAEFDGLPVRTVFEAIGTARSEVRAQLRTEPSAAPAPEQIERLARDRLRAASVG
jgi:hypothetical protein